MPSDPNSQRGRFAVRLSAMGKPGRQFSLARTCLLVAMTILATPLQANPPTETRTPFIITADFWCPYTCAEDAQEQGFAVELAREIFEAQGERVIYRVLPFYRAYTQTGSGRFQMAVALVRDNAGTLLFSEEIMGLDRTVLVMRKTDPVSYSGPQMLDGLKIGTASEYSYDGDGELDQYLKTRRSNRDRIVDIYSETPMDSLLPMLLSGRIDVFPENEDVVRYVASREGVLDKISIIETGLGNQLYAGFPRNEDGVANMAKFNEGMRRLRATGRFEQIMRAYSLAQDSQVQ